ncbi:MAG: SMC-Scp complex subunit ScpB [Thermoguttaceae bacterium]
MALRYRGPLDGHRWPPVPPRPGILSPIWTEQTGPAAPEAAPARTPALARLEAVLFLAREPVAARKLAELAGLADGTEARTLVRALNGLYDEEGCAFRVLEVAGGFQLRTRAEFAPWLRRVEAAEQRVQLSAPALETLAVIAYRQPVLRAEIESIRGVQCGEVLRQLMERDLVRIVGRSDQLGRPFLYGTTRYFLEVFGLRHLDELPRLNQSTDSNKTEGDSNVKILTDADVVSEEGLARRAAAAAGGPGDLSAAKRAYQDDQDYDASEEEDEDEYEEEEEEEDLEDEEGFEDEEWEEVEDEDEEADDLDEEEEEQEDEDWEDENEEDWEDEEDEDWEDEEEGED